MTKRNEEFLSEVAGKVPETRHRRVHGVRARTEHPPEMRRHLRVMHEEEGSGTHAKLPDRPRTRAECEDGPRPCPWVGCGYNLYLDVNESRGTLKLNFPDREPGQMPSVGSCALDVAERGGVELEVVGLLTNLTRERIRQMELSGGQRFYKELRRRGLLEAFRAWLGDAYGRRSGGQWEGVTTPGTGASASAMDESPPEGEREDVPGIPHILDPTVSDAQYAAAIRKVWDKHRDGRALKPKGG